MSRQGSWEKRQFESNPIAYAERRIEDTYGDKVSVYKKAKALNKFGLSLSIGTSLQTIARFPSVNETYVSTNIINRVVSTNAGDNQTLIIEGHTIDLLGNLTFSAQQVTLNGQSVVTLSTPIARANRVYVKPSGVFNSPQSLPVGTVSVYDNLSGVSSGVPTLNSSVKATIQPGEPTSQKCATSISQSDYYIVTTIEAGVGSAGGNASRILIRPETRDVANGGVWRPLGRELTLAIADNGVQFKPDPFYIVPKNHDVRIRAKTDSNTASVFGEINGYLAGII